MNVNNTSTDFRDAREAHLPADSAEPDRNLALEFRATEAADGALLKGVRFESHQVHTHSLSMRSRSGTIRLIECRHNPDNY